MRRLLHSGLFGSAGLLPGMGLAVLLALPLAVAAHASGAASSTTTTTHRSSHRSRAHVQESTTAKKHISHLQHSTRVATSTSRRYSGARLRRASLTVRR